MQFYPLPETFFSPNFEVLRKSVHLKKKNKGLCILKDFLFNIGRKKTKNTFIATLSYSVHSKADLCIWREKK